MDTGIGKIMETLEKLNIEENTLVLFFSDNGPAPNEGGTTAGLRGHKFQEWEGGVRVPAVMKWPSGFKGGRGVNQVMGYIDVLPTLREIAGIKSKSQKKLDGVSMLAVLEGKKQKIERDFCLGYGAIVNNEWKLVKKDSRNSWIKLKEDMLFNIQEDPEETINVKNKNPGIFKSLKKTVDNYDAIKTKQKVPSYQKGRKGFKALEEWNIEDYDSIELHKEYN